MPQWIRNKMAAHAARKAKKDDLDDLDNSNDGHKDGILEQVEKVEKELWREDDGAGPEGKGTDLDEELRKQELEISDHMKRNLSTRSMTMDLGSLPVPGAGHFIDAHWFQGVITVMIVANAAQMGVETDYPDHKDFYLACEWIFNTTFFVEMVCKLYFLRLGFFRQGWNILDFVLVCMSIFDGIMYFITAGGNGGTLRSFSSLRMLRIIRILKMVRLLKAFKELWLIIKGILDSVKTIFWASSLMIILLYVCGIFFTKMVGQNTSVGYMRQIDETDDPVYHDDWDAYEHFGTIPRTMFTLFETSIEPLNLRPVIERQPGLFPFFFIFIFLTNWGVMNVIIGVIVDNTMEASKSASADQAKLEDIRRFDQVKLLRAKIKDMDKDGDGRISLEELKEALEDEGVREYLDELDLPIQYDNEEVFHLFNPGGNSTLDDKEVMKQILRTIVHDEKQHLLELKLLVNRGNLDIKNELQMIKDLQQELRSVNARLGAQSSDPPGSQKQTDKAPFESLNLNGVAGEKPENDGAAVDGNNGSSNAAVDGNNGSSNGSTCITTAGSNESSLGSLGARSTPGAKAAKLANENSLAELLEAAQLRCGMECPNRPSLRLHLHATASTLTESSLPSSMVGSVIPATKEEVHDDAMADLHVALCDIPADDMMRLSPVIRKKVRGPKEKVSHPPPPPPPS